MPDDRDDFEGIDISGPWGGVRIGSGPRGAWDVESEGDAEYRRIRRRVRHRLDFYRHLVLYAFVVGAFAFLDWITGGGWWVQWLAGIWGAFILIQFFTTFVSPNLWGRDVEERMVRREMQRRQGSVSVVPGQADQDVAPRTKPD
jgi:hypothetical protein